MNDEGRLHSALATSQITCPNCSASICEPWPRCGCGMRFPAVEHLQRHIARTGCQSEREYGRVRRLPRPGSPANPDRFGIPDMNP